jgi:ribosomal protein S9
MDQNDIRAIRLGISRGLSQYLPAEGDAPIELKLLLHRLQKAEEQETDPKATEFSAAGDQ